MPLRENHDLLLSQLCVLLLGGPRESLQVDLLVAPDNPCKQLFAGLFHCARSLTIHPDPNIANEAAIRIKKSMLASLVIQSADLVTKWSSGAALKKI